MAEQNTNQTTDDVTTDDVVTDGTGTNSQTEGTPTVEELLAQLATERAASEKNKAALDKALKEKGELTKSLRARQTEAEQKEAAKKEQEEQRAAYVQELETYKRTNEAEKRYSLQGMDAKTAAAAAKAEIDGDMDALSDIQKQYTAQLLRENDAKWMKKNPQPNAGGQYQAMTRDQIMAIPDRTERLKAIALNPEAFEGKQIAPGIVRDVR